MGDISSYNSKGVEILAGQKVFNLQKLIDNLVAEVSTSDFTSDTLNNTKLAMTLMLINMAIKSVPRTKRLFEFTELLEDRIFDKNKIPELNTQQQLDVYKLAIERQNNSAQFIDFVHRNIKWGELADVLTILAKTEVSGVVSKEAQKDAQEILKKIEELKEYNALSQTEDIEIKDMSVADDEGSVDD